MLTNDEFQEAKKLWGGTDCLAGKMVDELLTLREAVAPQMAEVDVLLIPYQMNPIAWTEELWGRLNTACDKLRTAILAREREKQRADDAEKIIRELKDNFGEMEVGA